MQTGIIHRDQNFIIPANRNSGDWDIHIPNPNASNPNASNPDASNPDASVQNAL